METTELRSAVYLARWYTDIRLPTDKLQGSASDCLTILASIQLHRAVQHRSTIHSLPQPPPVGFTQPRGARSSSTAQASGAADHDSGRGTRDAPFTHMLIEPNLRVLLVPELVCAYVRTCPVARVTRRKPRILPCVSNGSRRDLALALRACMSARTTCRSFLRCRPNA